MADLRYLVPSIRRLQKEVGTRSYGHLLYVLAGVSPASVELAKRIESATNGAVKAVWLLGLEDPPPPVKAA